MGQLGCSTVYLEGFPRIAALCALWHFPEASFFMTPGVPHPYCAVLLFMVQTFWISSLHRSVQRPHFLHAWGSQRESLQFQIRHKSGKVGVLFGMPFDIAPPACGTWKGWPHFFLSFWALTFADCCYVVSFCGSVEFSHRDGYCSFPRGLKAHSKLGGPHFSLQGVLVPSLRITPSSLCHPLTLIVHSSRGHFDGVRQMQQSMNQMMRGFGGGFFGGAGVPAIGFSDPSAARNQQVSSILSWTHLSRRDSSSPRRNKQAVVRFVKVAQMQTWKVEIYWAAITSQVAVRNRQMADPFGGLFMDMDRMMGGMMGNMHRQMVSDEEYQRDKFNIAARIWWVDQQVREFLEKQWVHYTMGVQG